MFTLIILDTGHKLAKRQTPNHMYQRTEGKQWQCLTSFFDNFWWTIVTWRGSANEGHLNNKNIYLHCFQIYGNDYSDYCPGSVHQ